MATPLYPLTDTFKERLAALDIDPTVEPFNHMLAAIEAYEHGNGDTDSVYPDLTLEQYTNVAIDLAACIHLEAGA